MCDGCGRVFWGDLLGPALGLPLLCFSISLFFSGASLWRWLCIILGGALAVCGLFWVARDVIRGRLIRRSFDPCRATIPRHTWTPWAYEREGSCIRTRSCPACGREEQEQSHTEWAAWQYKADRSCTQVRTCRRCGAAEEKAADHQWTVTGTERVEGWSSDDPARLLVYEHRQCSRCGHTETVLVADRGIDVGFG